MKGQITGMRGVYLVAAELSRLGFIATPTSRSAMAADVLVTDQGCQQPFTVQVKTNAKAPAFWLIGKKVPVSPTHVYLLVNLESRQDRTRSEFFVVPSQVVRDVLRYEQRPNSEWWSVFRKDIPDYENAWSLFGDPHAEMNVDAG